MRLLYFFIGSFFLATTNIAVAEVVRPSNIAPAVGGSSILQIIFSLILVLAVIVLVAWLLKRINVAQPGKAQHLKVLGGIAIGQRERVVLLEVADTWLVVGVGPGQIRTLHTLAKSSTSNDAESAVAQHPPFNMWLKKIIEKRDAS